jgi:hypothetical protein
MFLLRRKSKAAPPAGKGESNGKPPLSPKSAQKAKSAEEAKKEAFKQAHEEEKKEKPKPTDVERVAAKDDEDDGSHRIRTSRRISQTQIGKPLSYNAYITQTKLNQPRPATDQPQKQ